MRYLMNILCCSLLLFREFECPPTGQWVQMTSTVMQINRTRQGLQNLDTFFMKYEQDIRVKQGSIEQPYLEICQSLAFANVKEDIIDKPEQFLKLWNAQRYCYDPVYRIVNPQHHDIKYDDEKFSNQKIEPLILFSCHCQFNGSYHAETIFYFTELILENLIPRKTYYIQFDTYTNPNLYYQLAKCWKLEGI